MACPGCGSEKRLEGGLCPSCDVPNRNLGRQILTLADIRNAPGLGARGLKMTLFLQQAREIYEASSFSGQITFHVSPHGSVKPDIIQKFGEVQVSEDEIERAELPKSA